MNLFRLLGDMSHLASILILLHKIQTSRSCRGISFKTQALYVMVFLSRYIDLFTFHFVSLYNTSMKIFFISSSVYILYLMKFKYRPTNDPSIDTFEVLYLIGPAGFLSLVFNYEFTVSETGEAETITTHYIAALGAYRALYIPNWIYRYWTEGNVDPIAVVAGLVQTGLYLDFFYVYFNRVVKGEKFELPA
ncbi:ER lumen protein-retaining receptor [Ceratobasidium sp. AG-Ba]|nr:ER lumen protein-retaining receptor [Ceratobasidium sp. AG-Ba]